MERHAAAIVRAVIYASLFDYPLTLPQVHETLVGCSLTPEQILAVYDSSPALRAIVEHRDGFFFPYGRFDLVAERRRREARSREFLARHARLLRWIAAIPFTRLVALSGSIAHLNLEEGGDLDLFLITRGRRVWLVTLAVIVLTRLLGVRRIVCANFVMSDSHLTLEQQDLFTANQVIHLKPLIGEQVLEGFVAANPFVRRYYPNRPIVGRAEPAMTPSPRQLRAKRALEMLFAIPSTFLDAASRRAYAWHLRRRSRAWRSPEQVALGADYLKLHTKSHRQSVMERFERRVADALVEGERAAIA